MARKPATFPFYRQLETMDCGPTCLRMVSKYYGRNYSLEELRSKSHITRQGVSMMDISDAGEAIGFRTLAAQLDFKSLKEDAPLPAIAYWRQRHFVVIYKIRKERITIADPAHGKVTLTKKEFMEGWADTQNANEKEGVALLLEPTPAFFDKEGDDQSTKKIGWKHLIKYLSPHKNNMLQLSLGLLLGSLLQMIFPFLTQSIVDVGIKNQDIGFIYLIMAAQLMLFLGKSFGEFLRSWIVLHMGSRMNIVLVTDFLIKLMKLPIGYFDRKVAGDIMQRIHDHGRFETLLTTNSLEIVFAYFNLAVYGIILAWYNMLIFWIFLCGTILYILWVLLFMKKRAEVDYKRFDQQATNQNTLIQMVYGMQEIKMNNAEKQNRWKWERIRAKLFKTGIKGLAIEQYQNLGSNFINELKNILITVLAAKAVIEGELTLGMMLSVQYIIGQMNSPVGKIVIFMRSIQDSKMALERIGEVYEKEEEEPADADRITVLPQNRVISVENLSFRYQGPHSPLALENVSLSIPTGKVTAIVGGSGSGKTTLLKLILKFYDPTEGTLKLGDTNLRNFSHKVWRQHCGTVLQNGYIFSDTIARNIAVGHEHIDKNRLLYAVKVANIQEHIEGLPMSYNTKIGVDGQELSQGQKQRILIARAVYKDPEFLFFDEATNALDANNEKTIMANLEWFFEGKTVVVVAHRLSTVKNADQIIVLDKGRLVEAGTHETLTAKRGSYYKLVKNQLELGN